MGMRTMAAVLGALAVAMSAGADWRDEIGKGWRTLRPGVRVREYAFDQPRLMRAYVVRINLTEPGIGFAATERAGRWGEPLDAVTNASLRIETKCETTVAFMERLCGEGRNAVVAVNTAAWSPYPPPKGCSYADPSGWCVSGGVEVSRPDRPRGVFAIRKDGTAAIGLSEDLSKGKDIAFAASGFGLIMTNGVVAADGLYNPANQHPRTAIGLADGGRTLVFLVVDGRQPGYSLGADLDDLRRMLRSEGVTDAVNMDGGGSSSLVVRDPATGRARMLNRHVRCRTRATAVNFAVTFDGDVPREVERSASVYHSYEFGPVVDTPAPKGFKPFYISHYGRHGSRRLTGSAISDVMGALEKADKRNVLTETGRSLLGQMHKIAAIHDEMNGQLTERGVWEHRRLARRMAERFPDVFSRPRRVRCRSSVSPRVLTSQVNFTMALKEAAPQLEFDFATGERHHKVINPLHWARKDRPDVVPRTTKLCDSLVKDLIDPKPLVGRIFAAGGEPENPLKFAQALFECASICQCCRCELDGQDIYGIFEAGEIEAHSRALSARHYLGMGNSEEFGEFVSASEAKLAHDIAACAQAAVADDRIAADLRFGHDSGLWPLAGFLGLEGPGDRVKAADSPSACPAWKWLPMAANFQMVLYRNSLGDVLVKFLWNEREMRMRGLVPVSGPYYRWSDVRARME